MRIWNHLRCFIFERVQSSVFLTNFFNIASASLCSQLLLLAATPILTRLYLPEDFGATAVFVSALQIIGSFCTWRFDRTIPNAQTEFAARALVKIGLLALIFVASAVMAIVHLNPWHVIELSNLQSLGMLVYLLPVAIFATGLLQLGAAWFARETTLKVISYSVIAYSLTYLFCGVIIGILISGPIGLIFSFVLALWIQVPVLLYFLVPTKSPVRATLSKLKAIFARHIRLASTASLVTLVNTLSFAAPVFLLAHQFPMSKVGLYSLMVRIIATPLGVITKSLSISFWSRAAQLARQRNYALIWSLYLKVSLSLSVLAATIALICILLNHYLAFFLGDNWTDAGAVLVAAIPYLMGLTIFSPTNHLIVLGKQASQLFADGLRLVLMFVTLYFSAQFNWSFTTVVFLFSLSSLAGHILLFIIHMRIYSIRLDRR